MEELINDLHPLLQNLLLNSAGLGILRATFLVLTGLIVARFFSAAGGRLLRQRVGLQGLVLVRRLIFYSLFSLFLVSAMHEAGFDLSVLLGAAGVLTVALGFASQTSASNLISGLFLFGERAFEIGESVTIGDVTGEILSIDWMSVKIRTFDNLMVRLPNEMVLKAKITNLSRFPIRRLDQQIQVALNSSIDHVREVLMQVANANPLCLDEPKPILFHQGFTESGVKLQFSVWFLTPNLPELRNRLPQEISEAFTREDVDIPFPQRIVTLQGTSSSGSGTE